MYHLREAINDHKILSLSLLVLYNPKTKFIDISFQDVLGTRFDSVLGDFNNLHVLFSNRSFWEVSRRLSGEEHDQHRIIWSRSVSSIHYIPCNVYNHVSTKTIVLVCNRSIF
jgi:hypothetical protein